MIRALVLCLACAACASDLPTVDASVSDAARAQAYPVLIPLDDILTDAAMPSRAAPLGDGLRARGARLSRSRIAAPAGSDLAARGARLRARAEALRNADI